MTEGQDTVLTIEELSTYLKISKSTLYKLAQAGKLPGQKVGKHWRFKKEAVDCWLEEGGPTKSSTTGASCKMTEDFPNGKIFNNMLK
jgi:excisionase family DNA binding protein